MSSSIQMRGKAHLREVYFGSKNVEHYVVLSMTANANEGGKDSSPVDIEIPISAERYWELRRELSESNTDESHLGVDGNLELSVCGYMIRK